MKDNLIYEKIAKRCGGDIYLGVVGPVRTGKSTFIARMLDGLIIPNIENEFDRERTVDEIPQSASGRTITTTEPKFIPSDAVAIRVGDTHLKVKLIDSVGYCVEGAIGAYEGDTERAVMTPWSDEAMPFSRASEIGTKRVLEEHSTVALLVSCDGSICDIPRENYVSAEERCVSELKASGKPFAIILNSSHPDSKEAHELAKSLEEKYSSPVALVNCSLLNKADIDAILTLVLGEFPISEIKIKLPDWLSRIPSDDPLSDKIYSEITRISEGVKKISDAERYCRESENVTLLSLDASCGEAKMEIPIGREVFYSVMSELCGVEVATDGALFDLILELTRARAEYGKIKSALDEARESGYGIVLPSADELKISEPASVKAAGGWGVSLTAKADAIHIIKTPINAKICPVVGTQEQSSQVAEAMRVEYGESPDGILSARMLGRSILDLVNDSMEAKITRLTPESREKLAGAIGRIVDEGSDGLICILV
ncbi:MAG: stage IV sporulation protein A [Clostridia bacterium]|nr:stage IV sporulation protein A [Clostridia bacterium]